MAREYEDQIQDRVNEFKGKTSNIALRFSIAWNECMLLDDNDLDAHCLEPTGNLIFYQSKQSPDSDGNLDVDIITPHDHDKYAVENIVFSNIRTMSDGKYQFLVHCYSGRGGKGGFRAEIEVNNKRYEFHYNQILRQNDKVIVADVELRHGEFSVNPHLPPVQIISL